MVTRRGTAALEETGKAAESILCGALEKKSFRCGLEVLRDELDDTVAFSLFMFSVFAVVIFTLTVFTAPHIGRRRDLGCNGSD